MPEPLTFTFNRQNVADLIRKVAKEIIRPNFKNPDNAARTKATDTDIQTDADIAAEQALKEGLLNILPEARFLGEEEIENFPEAFDSLKEVDVPVWVVDPIDGTSNYYYGKDRYACMVALVMNGKPIMGWIYDVPGDRMGFAEQGKGAFIDDVKLDVNADDAHQPLKGFAYRTKRIKDIEREHGPLDLDSYRCTAHEYLALAAGERDFSIYKHTKPWDHMAGMLLLTESGGLAQHWDGKDYDAFHDAGIVNARNEDVLESINFTISV